MIRINPKTVSKIEFDWESAGIEPLDTSSALDKNGQGVSSGTTIIAVCTKNGVVIGADTRTSAGGYIVNRASRKISPISDNIFVARSGSAADTQFLTQNVKRYISEHAMELKTVGKMPCVKSVANLFRLFCYNYKDFLSAGLIIAGYDDVDGPSIHSIPLGGTLIEKVPFAIGGSGSIFISTFLNQKYDENLSLEETRSLVREAVSHAIYSDASSGGMVRTVAIDLNGQVIEDVTPVLNDQLLN